MSPEDYAVIISTVSTFVNLAFLETSVLALFLYDIILPLPSEITGMWQRKLRLSTIFYFAMRYLPLADLLFVNFGENTPHCDSFMKPVTALNILARGAVVATLAIRTCAICKFHRHRLIQAGVCFLGFLTVGFDFLHIPAITCRAENVTLEYWLTINIIIRLIFEGVVVIVTIIQTFPTVKLQRSLKAFQGQSLMELILKSGVVYFVTVYAIDLTNVTYFIVAPHRIITGTLSLPLSTILISRFLLDLRSTDSHSEETHTAHLATISFNLSPSHIRSALVTDFGDAEENSWPRRIESGSRWDVAPNV